jgi:radical SAM superfamily enzyme YgiQ (UPF0313 family)
VAAHASRLLLPQEGGTSVGSGASVLLTTVYRKDRDDYYDWVRANTRVLFGYTSKRILSSGLRFIAQNVPGIEILEYPTREQFIQKLSERRWHAVGFSFYLNELPEIIDMVRYARKAKVKEIWSGNYGALTENIEEYFDRIFVGYAEEQIARLLGHDIEEIVHPPLISYIGTSLGQKLFLYGALYTTRGCPNGCVFCQTPAFCPKPYKISMRSIERVLDFYLKEGTTEAVIMDENFGIFSRHSKDVVSLLGELGFRWYVMTSVHRLSKNLDFWARNGMTGAFVGVESMNQGTLEEIGKKHTVAETVEAVDRMHRRNRIINGYYIIGFENETTRDIKENVKKVARLKLDVTQVCVLTPFPRTGMWDYIKDRYGIFDTNWHHYEGKHLVWNHPLIEPRQMHELLEWSLRECYRKQRPFESYRKLVHAYKELEKDGCWRGLRALYRSYRKASRYDYFPREIPFIEN